MIALKRDEWLFSQKNEKFLWWWISIHMVKVIWSWYKQIITMRLASIIRRTMPSTPFRGGVPPIWDRPDPPPQKKEIRNRRVHPFSLSTLWRKNISPSSTVLHPLICLSTPKSQKVTQLKLSLFCSREWVSSLVSQWSLVLSATYLYRTRYLWVDDRKCRMSWTTMLMCKIWTRGGVRLIRNMDWRIWSTIPGNLVFSLLDRCLAWSLAQTHVWWWQFARKLSPKEQRCWQN